MASAAAAVRRRRVRRERVFHHRQRHLEERLVAPAWRRSANTRMASVFFILVSSSAVGNTSAASFDRPRETSPSASGSLASSDVGCLASANR